MTTLANTTQELRIERRAFQLCSGSEPHYYAPVREVPCQAHRDEACRQLSAAAFPASTGVHPRPGAEGAGYGVLGCESGPSLDRPGGVIELDFPW